MKLLKHILVVVGLVVAALPCSHAVGHDAHAHAPDASSEIQAPNPCHCHSCEDEPCGEAFAMPQELTVASAFFSVPVSSLQLFIFSETQPVARPIPPAVTGVLSALQTVQLLI